MVANILTDLTDWIDEIAAYWWFPADRVRDRSARLGDPDRAERDDRDRRWRGGGRRQPATWRSSSSPARPVRSSATTSPTPSAISSSHGSTAGPSKKPERVARLASAADQIKRRGGPLLITARFIPGGRTVLTVSCGLTAQPRRWFAFWIAIAAIVWASYAACLGYAFGACVRGRLDARLSAGVRGRPRRSRRSSN